jgi:hypothetical protein
VQRTFHLKFSGPTPQRWAISRTVGGRVGSNQRRPAALAERLTTARRDVSHAAEYTSCGTVCGQRGLSAAATQKGGICAEIDTCTGIFSLLVPAVGTGDNQLFTTEPILLGRNARPDRPVLNDAITARSATSCAGWSFQDG